MPSPCDTYLSVVTPVFNEALCLREFHRRLTAVLTAMGAAYEIIMVDDGSHDETPQIIDELRRADPQLRPLRFRQNHGQSAATAAGLAASRGRCVAIMDADLQHAPEDLPRFVAELEKGFDLVAGRRTNRAESFLTRRLPSLVANFAIRVATGSPARDNGGYACLRGDMARRLRLRKGFHRLLPALVHLNGGRVSEVETTAPPRLAGKSHYGLGRTPDVALDLLYFAVIARQPERPLYWWGKSGGAMMLLGLLAVGYSAFRPAAGGCLLGALLVLLAACLLLCGVVFERLAEATDAPRAGDLSENDQSKSTR